MKVQKLLDQGVRIPNPASVCIAEDIDPARIASGVVLMPGVRLRGSLTSIAAGCVVGEEAPATIDNCQLGANVRLKGGYFSESVFLDDVSIDSCAHVRPGCLLEEGVKCGHSVGLKQTVLMPFVTLGSLINFCDCLMAGGSGERCHSEVGSSFVHFNFSSHQDKATASLFGDVPRGVLLDQAPVFLGGQGGVVGPCRIAYGTVMAAGTVCRRDVLDTGFLVIDELEIPTGRRPYRPECYGDVSRIVRNSVIYIGNLLALRQWYASVRSHSMQGDPFRAACLKGALQAIDRIVDERFYRLNQLRDKVCYSLELARSESDVPLNGQPFTGQQSFVDKWPACAEQLRRFNAAACGESDRDAFLAAWSREGGGGYVERIQALPKDARTHATRWLQSVVTEFAGLIGDGPW